MIINALARFDRSLGSRPRLGLARQHEIADAGAEYSNPHRKETKADSNSFHLTSANVEVRGRRALVNNGLHASSDAPNMLHASKLARNSPVLSTALFGLRFDLQQAHFKGLLQFHRVARPNYNFRRDIDPRMVDCQTLGEKTSLLFDTLYLAFL